MSRTPAGIVITILFVAATLCALAAVMVDERLELDAVATPADVDLGNVTPETRHRTAVVLKNAGRSVAHIRKVSSTCGCTVAEITQRIVEPGAKSPVSVTVKSGTDAGTVVRTVYVEISNEENTLTKVIAIPIRLTVRNPT